MRSQTTPPTPRTTPRSLQRKAAVSAAAQPRKAAKAAPPDGPGTDEPTPALELAAGPTLLEGPTREEMIRARAYERYERNGCVDGHDLDDWLAAEAEVGALMTEGRTRATA